MKSSSTMTRRQRAGLALLALCGAGAVVPAHSQTALADQPLFATANVPGNLALVLSVEFPTAISVAHTNRTYASANQYLGYFDPDKCYTYNYTDGTSVNNYFVPSSKATNHVCSGKWSGNFLNWATMQTIDPFRWVLTGGYRVIDETTLTVVEKAWGANQGGYSNFPNSSIDSTTLAGATPYSAPYNGMNTRIWALGNKMRFSLSSGSSFLMQGQYYNSTDLSGPVVLTRTDNGTAFITGGVSPGPGVNTYNYSVRWTGSITAPATGSYTFQTVSDDGVRLYVNNQLVIDNFTYHAPSTNTGVITLNAGSTVNIELDYFQGAGGATIDLQWLTPVATTYTPLGTTAGADLNTPPIQFNGSNAAMGTPFDLFVRVKTCDASVGLEANCTQYGSNYKPEGLIQQYSNKMRFSALGYLNDGNILRDGGVLRAQQKFVGPTQPVPGSTPITNAPDPIIPGQKTGAEWEATTGKFTLNPDEDDAKNTATLMGLPKGSVTSSGVMNYLNKFGQAAGNYKTNDNVSELYYAAIRYLKNLPNVPEWTAVPSNTSQSTIATWVDGFPVITSPPDPILYSCQRNFILGIGDTNTHADKNVPGNVYTNSEPTPMPKAVTNDAPTNNPLNGVDAVARTNQIGAMEGLGNIGNQSNYNGGDANSAYMAGLAYDAHVKDIRGRTVVAPAVPQTISTYWVDVQEYQQYAQNNQFYLATKYGGFTVPAGYDASSSNTTSLTLGSWHTNTDGNGGQSTDANGAQPRPDHYYSGGQPAAMQAGLNAAFADIAASITAYTTSFATALPQVSQTSNASFSTQYDSSVWTGEVTASVLTFDPITNAPTLQTPPAWTLSANLAKQFAGTGWNTNRRVVTWNGSAGVAFRSSGSSQLASTDLDALDTTYGNGTDSTNYLNYLRGDQSNEVGVSGGTKAYRKRTKLIGDIVGAQATPVGPPSFPFSDANNAGYSAFKTKWASRRTVVYVGANDGMMHAINGALLTTTPTTPAVPPLEVDSNAGTEMFAYVPRALFQGPNGTPNVDGLASLGNPSFSHHYMVNATPAYYDLDFRYTPGSTSTAADWRTVLIGGLGKGSKSYYALDITDPVGMTNGGESTVASKVLWEFSNSTKNMNNQLGYSYGLPLVTKTAKYGWVAIFTSGYNNADGQGYFFFVNPRTGELLEMVSTGAGSPTNDAGLAHANAFVLDSSNGVADSVYAGDLLGNLWRLDLTGTSGRYPAPVKIATLTDSSGKAQPVTTVPSVEVDPTSKKRVVMLGTGRLLDTSDIASKAGQSIYAFFDGTNASFTAKPVTPLAFPYSRSVLADNTGNALTGTVPAATQAGWFEDLGVDVSTTSPAHTGTGIAWRVVSDPTTLSGSIAYATVLPSGDPCNPSGQSRALGRQYANGLTTVKDPTTLAPTSYVSFSGTITNLRYMSVNGKAVLVVGTDSGGVGQININPSQPLTLRRLNWRELQSVD